MLVKKPGCLKFFFVFKCLKAPDYVCLFLCQGGHFSSLRRNWDKLSVIYWGWVLSLPAGKQMHAHSELPAWEKLHVVGLPKTCLHFLNLHNWYSFQEKFGVPSVQIYYCLKTKASTSQFSFFHACLLDKMVSNFLVISSLMKLELFSVWVRFYEVRGTVQILSGTFIHDIISEMSFPLVYLHHSSGLVEAGDPYFYFVFKL